MKNLYNFIRRLSVILGTIIQYITIVIILFLLILSVAQVFLRTFNLPQMGVEELMKFPTIWMYMLGGICASFTRTHIDCGIIESFIKSTKVKQILGIIKCVLSIIVSVYVIKWTAEYLEYCFKTNKLSVIYGIPWTIANVAIMVGIVGMLVYVILELIEILASFIVKEEEPES